jgi:uncharacterized membrane protein YgcG
VLAQQAFQGTVSLFEVRIMTWKLLLSLLALGSLAGWSFSDANADEVLISPFGSEKPLNDLFSKQWMKIDENGGIGGRILEITSVDKRPLPGLPVSLVQDGKVVASATSNERGEFRFKSIPIGSYSLVTRTNQSFAALALQVLDAQAGGHLSSDIEVRPVRSTGTRVQEIIRSQTVPMTTGSSFVTSTPSSDPIADERRFALSHVVKLDGNGNVVGRLAKPGVGSGNSHVEGTSIFVLRGNDEVARTEVDAEGKFTISGLTPGVYGFIAAGASGIGATAFQVVDAGIATKGSNGSKLVSVNLQTCCPALNCEIVPMSEVACCEPQIVETIVQEPIAACEQPVVEDCGCGCDVAPACGGGCGCGWGGGYGYGGGGYGGGGGGGGGGFLGGGGGFGGLIGLAGLAGIAAVVADNNNDSSNLNQVPISVRSPIIN